jgi:putative copper export protein
MISNYFHDLAVAFLFSSFILFAIIYNSYIGFDESDDLRTFLKKIYNYFSKVIIAAWGWIIIGGVIRTLNYREYEWLPAVGRKQIAALVVKHIVLVILVGLGAYMQYKFKKIISKED